MPNYIWVKFYHSALQDRRLATLPDNLYRRFFELCLLAGDERAARPPDQYGFLPAVEDIAFILRLDELQLTAELDQLADKGFIDRRPDPGSKPAGLDRWYVTNFAERQKPTGQAERQRQYRQRQKEKKEAQKKEKQKEGITDNRGREDIEGRYITDDNTPLRNVTLGELPAFVPSLPAIFQSDSDFIAAWDRWLAHCDERGIDFTPAQAHETIDELTPLNGTAAKVVSYCVKRGWKSIHVNLALDGLQPTAVSGQATNQGGRVTAAGSYEEVFND